jgi:hypothetical protein
MAINLSDNFFIAANKADSAKYGPWPSIAAAQAGIDPLFRHKGLTVGIDSGSGVVEYWWKDGTANAELILKGSSSGDDLNVVAQRGNTSSVPLVAPEFNSEALKTEEFIFKASSVFNFNVSTDEDLIPTGGVQSIINITGMDAPTYSIGALISGQVQGKVFIIKNSSNENVTIVHNSSLHNATERFLLPNNSNFVLSPGAGAIFIYLGNAFRIIGSFTDPSLFSPQDLQGVTNNGSSTTIKVELIGGFSSESLSELNEGVFIGERIELEETEGIGVGAINNVPLDSPFLRISEAEEITGIEPPDVTKNALAFLFNGTSQTLQITNESPFSFVQNRFKLDEGDLFVSPGSGVILYYSPEYLRWCLLSTTIYWEADNQRAGLLSPQDKDKLDTIPNDLLGLAQAELLFLKRDFLVQGFVPYYDGGLEQLVNGPMFIDMNNNVGIATSIEVENFISSKRISVGAESTSNVPQIDNYEHENSFITVPFETVITGIIPSPQFPNEIIFIRNSSETDNVTLLHDSLDSDPSNRFFFKGDLNLTLEPGDCVLLLYSVSGLHWLLVGGTTSVIGEVYKNSLEKDIDNAVQLVGDEDVPGPSKYYGTDETGTKGFHNFIGGGGIQWEVITTNTIAEGDKGYIADSASKIEVILDDNYPEKVVRVTSKNTGGWKISFISPVTVVFIDEIVTDSLESTIPSDAVELLNIGPDRWQIISLVGNIQFTNV